MKSAAEASYAFHQRAEAAEAAGLVLPTVVTAAASIDNYRHVRMIEMLAGELAGAYPSSSWLTVGDGHYGSDAIRLSQKGVRVHASSLTDATLAISHSRGWISEFSAQNAEHLDLPDSSFDFVLCKEAYHHLPRPAVALYEMLRVARVAVVLIEPNRRPATPLGFLRTLVKRATGRDVMAKYEPSGNYIFRLSLPEIIEMSRALDLPAVAWRYFNDFYHPGFSRRPVANPSTWAIFRAGILVQDILCRLRLMPFGGLTCAVFKTAPEGELETGLKRRGIRLVRLPRNPYLTGSALNQPGS